MELNVGAIKDRIERLELTDMNCGLSTQGESELGVLRALLLAFTQPTVQGFPNKGRTISMSMLDIAAVGYRPPPDFGTYQYVAAPKSYPGRKP